MGLSASAASRRILALEASGAIRGYRALIDDRLLGKHMTVYHSRHAGAAVGRGAERF